MCGLLAVFFLNGFGRHLGSMARISAGFGSIAHRVLYVNKSEYCMFIKPYPVMYAYYPVILRRRLLFESKIRNGFENVANFGGFCFIPDIY